MKRILVAIFSVFMAFGAARADCASNEFAVGAECVESKFQITTIEMDADTTFSFYISAMGTFYVDWGDGATEKIERTNTTETLYSHTYISAGSHIIQLGGLATGYNENLYSAIRFFTGTIASGYASVSSNGTEIYISRISGAIGAIFPTIGNGDTNATQPLFEFLFTNAKNLTGVIPAGLFTGIFGQPRAHMFYMLFDGCTKLTGPIPSGLFGQIQGTYRQYMFARVFNNCMALGGNIPTGLFGTLSGVPASGMFNRTFFACGNLTGAIPDGLFGTPTGQPAPSMFMQTFYACSGLTGPIPKRLFGNLNGVYRSAMFETTFLNCSGLTGTIPDGLFGNLYGVPQPQMFYQTFFGCSGLTGLIPTNLFGTPNGAPALRMFMQTFYNCSGLTGTIPANLFGNITGPAANYAFNGTFSRCSNLTGYVPAGLFGTITGTATDTFTGVFYLSGIYTECPCGTHQYITGFESDWSGCVSCEVGTKDNEHWNDGVCTTDCTAGVTALKTSTGLSYPLLTDATAPQNIHIKVNNQICTVPLENGAANNAINMRWNGNTYHATVPDEIVPAGFTGQPE